MMKGGMGNMMKQAQQMQANMEKAQKEIAEAEAIGESGAGLVKVVINGKHDVKRVEIDPELMKDDKEMLEDLIAAAVNDANRRIEKISQEKMSSITAGMPIPPGLKALF